MKKSFIFIFVLGLLVSGLISAQEIEVPLRFDRYYTYEQVNEALQALHELYPELSSLDLVGYSEEDRAIYALTITNPATGEHRSKPGVYVDGNIHGNEISRQARYVFTWPTVCLPAMVKMSKSLPWWIKTAFILSPW
jgi:hypothetical protein